MDHGGISQAQSGFFGFSTSLPTKSLTPRIPHPDLAFVPASLDIRRPTDARQPAKNTIFRFDRNDETDPAVP